MIFPFQEQLKGLEIPENWIEAKPCQFTVYLTKEEIKEIAKEKQLPNSEIKLLSRAVFGQCYPDLREVFKKEILNCSQNHFDAVEQREIENFIKNNLPKYDGNLDKKNVSTYLKSWLKGHLRAKIKGEDLTEVLYEFYPNAKGKNREPKLWESFPYLFPFGIKNQHLGMFYHIVAETDKVASPMYAPVKIIIQLPKEHPLLKKNLLGKYSNIDKLNQLKINNKKPWVITLQGYQNEQYKLIYTFDSEFDFSPQEIIQNQNENVNYYYQNHPDEHNYKDYEYAIQKAEWLIEQLKKM